MRRYFLFLFLFIEIGLSQKPYRGGELRTIDAYRYGRYEVRMKSAAGDGVVSSFFTYRDYWAEGLTGPQHWNEIDWEWLGNHSIKWNGNNPLGKPSPSGIYFFLISNSKFIESKKLILLR